MTLGLSRSAMPTLLHTSLTFDVADFGRMAQSGPGLVIVDPANVQRRGLGGDQGLKQLKNLRCLAWAFARQRRPPPISAIKS